MWRFSTKWNVCVKQEKKSRTKAILSICLWRSHNVWYKLLIRYRIKHTDVENKLQVLVGVNFLLSAEAYFPLQEVPWCEINNIQNTALSHTQVSAPWISYIEKELKERSLLRLNTVSQQPSSSKTQERRLPLRWSVRFHCFARKNTRSCFIHSCRQSYCEKKSLERSLSMYFVKASSSSSDIATHSFVISFDHLIQGNISFYLRTIYFKPLWEHVAGTGDCKGLVQTGGSKWSSV